MLAMLFISKMPQISRRTVSIGIVTVLNHPLALEDDTMSRRFCADSHTSSQPFWYPQQKDRFFILNVKQKLLVAA